MNYRLKKLLIEESRIKSRIDTLLADVNMSGKQFNEVYVLHDQLTVIRADIVRAKKHPTLNFFRTLLWK